MFTNLMTINITFSNLLHGSGFLCILFMNCSWVWEVMHKKPLSSNLFLFAALEGLAWSLTWIELRWNSGWLAPKCMSEVWPIPVGTWLVTTVRWSDRASWVVARTASQPTPSSRGWSMYHFELSGRSDFILVLLNENQPNKLITTDDVNSTI